MDAQQEQFLRHELSRRGWDWERVLEMPQQEQLLRHELFSLTLMATMQRARVYDPRSLERERKAFRSSLRSHLEQIAQKYKVEVPEEVHIQNIVKLSDCLTEAHASVLKDRRFRIGTAQKALNLYLKYLWCFDKISIPPHCPFDFQIIAKLSNYNGPSWTNLDRVEDYRNLVTAAKAEAGGVPLAKWELQTYNKARPGAAPKGGPATHSGNSGASEGPPSVSSPLR
jgi:hypothetical protein